jgi:hypothetical protein
MLGRLVFARMYSDPSLDDVRADERSVSDKDLEERFAGTIEVLKCEAIMKGELQPDMEKTKEALCMVEEADRLAEENGWDITVFRETGELHVQIVPDTILDIQPMGPLFESAYRVSVDRDEKGIARFHFRYATHEYVGNDTFPW